MMGQDQEQETSPNPITVPSVTASQPESVPRPPFDPSRMIGIIKRKALIKDLAAAYHVECLAYCQELLDLQRKWDEPYIDMKVPEEPRKETMRPQKRPKKTR